jgi:hypothetical protein
MVSCPEVNTHGSILTGAAVMYDDVRKADSPKATLLEFMESAYEAGARTAGWDVEDLRAY